MEIDFASQFRALTARGDGAWDPFPWQERLFRRLIQGEVPAALDLPTGLGKTSVIAIWLIARAGGANLPRRLFYVVDRRAVVDQASAEAERLAERAKGLLADIHHPKISTLRGAHVDNRDWLADPAASAIIVGTVDMIGSRLLFEGYGVSRRMRPFHAGLIGADSLVVLDEAHLVPPFQALIDAVASDTRLAGTRRLPIPRGGMTVMALSATGRQGRHGDGIFRLDAADLAHDTVAERLHAAKALEHRTHTATDEKAAKDDLATALTSAALEVTQGAPAPILIYADSREVAEQVRNRLGMAGVPDDALSLLVGGRRLWERSEAEDALAALGFQAGGARPDRPTYLIATSAGEVGVDLDAGHMVCDLVAWERMVQRLGRVNRRGTGAARVIVCDQGAEVSPGGAKLAPVRDLLAQLPPAGDSSVQASPGALSDLARAQPDLVAAASSPAPLRPALTRALVESWALTGLEDHTGRPEIAPWLRGWVEEKPQVRLVWRTHLPDRAGAPAAEVEAFFEAAPPHQTEMLDTETWRAIDLLYARARALEKRRPAQASAPRDPDDEAPPAAALPDPTNTVVFVLAPDGKLTSSVRLDDLIRFAGPKATRPKRAAEAFERLAGATLVLDARLGGLSPSGLLDPGADGPVPSADTDARWASVVGFQVAKAPAETDKGVETHRFDLVLSDEGVATQVLIVTPVGPARDTANDGTSRTRTAISLAAHTSQVVAEIARIGRALGLPAQDIGLLELAARLHDAGKAATCWQEAMRAPRDGRPYAKTPRGDGRKLDGYRHEFGSLLVALADPAVAALAAPDRDLVLHLIAAHHGHARPGLSVQGVLGLWPPGGSPSAPPRAAPGAASAQSAVPLDAPPSVLERHALDAALRFARLQDHWGPWGLAWWETLLRAADQAASREPDTDAVPTTGGSNG